MAQSPESVMENHPIDFRAPPPSPVASGRRSSVTNNDMLTEFLSHSLQVPDLVLPDNIFPKQKPIENPPQLDFELLNSNQKAPVLEILESGARIGCFELVNHGIEEEVIKSVLTAGASMFELSKQKKATVARSPERVFGFEEIGDEEGEIEMSEEFVWCRDEELRLAMEGIWPLGYSSFSEKMGRLSSVIENMAEKILLVLQQNSLCKQGEVDEQEHVGSLCYLYKHCPTIGGSATGDEGVSSLRYDVIRMLVRGAESHSLCFHLCDGASEFHVYSKKGWVSFCPDKDAIVITFGDQLQAWRSGQYKHVIGRPIFKAESQNCTSMAFFYSPPNIRKCIEKNSGKAISLGQQVFMAIILTLVYQFLTYIYNKS